MRGQLKPLGLSIDWSREFATCDDDYVAQQQSLFLDFLDAGLIARKSAQVNWDPVDMTVLANEQVIDGKGWRSGAVVERKELTQWFFRISEYSDELLSALDGLTGWPDKVRLMQANWIGKSRGLQFRFATTGAPKGFDAIEVYTTRPDTLMGASFAALSPDHPLIRALAETRPEIAAFVEEYRKAFNAAAGDRSNALDHARRELKQVEKKIAGILSAIEDGLYHPSMKAKMADFESRKAQLTVSIEDTPEPPALRLHPRLSDLYREKIANLSQALQEPGLRLEATQILRSLITEIRMVPAPGATGGHEIELIGELAGILALSEADMTKPPRLARAGVGLRSETMVAGTGFEPVTFRL